MNMERNNEANDANKDSVRVLFFARLREALPTSELTLPWPSTDSAEQLRKVIAAQGPQWAVLDEQCLVSVNQTIVRPDHPVTPGDEVAFFPPVTGG